MQGKHLASAGVVALVLAVWSGTARASSHSDAPLIKLDPQANLTDVYAFIGTSAGGVKSLNVLIAVRPFCQAGDGGEWDKFSNDALYSINIADPASGELLIRYDFQFSPVSSAAGNFKNKDTILLYGQGAGLDVGPINSVGDAHQNYTQSYSVTKTTFFTRGSRSRRIGTNLLVPPPNPGSRVTPLYNGSNGFALNFTTAATTAANLDTLTKGAVFSLDTGETVFAGLREDGFFADAPAIFDLLNPRILGAGGSGQNGNGIDGFKGFNTLAYAIQIPVSSLPSRPYTQPALLGGAQTGVGVYASVSRPRITLLSATRDPQSVGEFIQVNRQGNPLFNEVLVNIVDKDNYNRASPTVDVTKFKKYANAPVIIVLLNATFGTKFVTSPRPDLVAIYIPDVIRVNTTTNPVPLPGQTGFSRLSAFGGDLTNGVPSGWPNGRRPGDDVIDIALTAIANGPAFTPPITPLGDNVNANDQLFNLVFPYLATPNSGTTNSTTPPFGVGGP